MNTFWKNLGYMLNNNLFFALHLLMRAMSFFCHFRSRLFSKVWCYSDVFDWLFCLNLHHPDVCQLNQSTLPLKAKQPVSESPSCLLIKARLSAGNFKNILFRNRKRAQTEQCHAKYVYQLLKCY